MPVTFPATRSQIDKKTCFPSMNGKFHGGLNEIEHRLSQAKACNKKVKCGLFDGSYSLEVSAYGTTH